MFEIFTNDARVTCGDSQQRDCGTVWVPTTLFPIAKGVDTDTHRLSKLRLSESYKSPKRRNVCTGFELSQH